MQRLWLEAKRADKSQGDVEIGELRLEADSNDCLMLMRDADNRRVSLKVTALGTQLNLLQGVLTEKAARGSLQLQSTVSECLQCVPKNYKVGESARTGFFRDEQTTIPKVNIDLHEQMRPYVYELGNDHNSPDEEGRQAGGLIDPKKRRKGGNLLEH